MAFNSLILMNAVRKIFYITQFMLLCDMVVWFHILHLSNTTSSVSVPVNRSISLICCNNQYFYLHGS